MRVHDRIAVRRLLRVAAGLVVVIVVATAVGVVVIRRAPGANAPRRPDVPEGFAVLPPPQPTAHPAPAAVAGAPAAPRAAATAVPRRKPAPAPAPATSPTPVDATEAILALRAAGETGGIAAFGLPGTDPPRAGIVVPEDFELPPGYLRHHQVTDDGETLPPILLFHPDYEFVDADGQPVALPANRVVPPELAPPGLPITMLEVPVRAPAGRAP